MGVEPQGGTTITPYTPEQEEEAAKILAEQKAKKEKREVVKQAKKLALMQQQAAKRKKLEEELERVKKEERKKMKVVDAEEEEEKKKAEEEVPLIKRSIRERGESSGTKKASWLEKKGSEWVANLSLGEEEEAMLYVPREEQEAAVKELDVEEDPLKRQTIEDEKKLEWKLHLTRERKKRMEAASKVVKELEEVKQLSVQLEAQAEIKGKWNVTRSVRASDKLQTIHSRQWRSARALKGVMDELVAVPDHGVTETQVVNMFYHAMPEPLRGHFFEKSKKSAMTYDILSREVVAFEVHSMPVSTFWHKDLDKGKKWKGRTISGQVKGKDHLILILDEGGMEEVPYDQIEWGLEEEDSSVSQGRTYAAVAAGGRPQGRGRGHGQGVRTSGGPGQGDQGVGGRGDRQAGGRGQGPPAKPL
ncbi:hypothetical protein CBR_g18914 [Chara braunii]|uniref:Uncharacterized protein n=1 Tax=Chara braunii TaxID=69332 RepID=A0A388KWR8_CHABU|nr:hypothetical protein CBR_g18914 [Chara braunii]|eukprot:GBG74504.1 hypothetical protein CBR_g18914 [Chara braunii]